MTSRSLCRFSVFDNVLSACSWAAYVAGMLVVLKREEGLRLTQGISLLIDSAVPEGKGVSSSAALEVSVMQALLHAHNLQLDGHRLAVLCQKVFYPHLILCLCLWRDWRKRGKPNGSHSRTHIEPFWHSSKPAKPFCARPCAISLANYMSMYELVLSSGSLSVRMPPPPPLFLCHSSSACEGHQYRAGERGQMSSHMQLSAGVIGRLFEVYSRIGKASQALLPEQLCRHVGSF